MTPSDIERLRIVAEMIDTRERSELARLTSRANSTRSEMQRLKSRLNGVASTGNPVAAEAFRKWCLKRLQLEAAALGEIESAIQNQMKSVARSTARSRVLEQLANDAHRERRKAKLSRNLESQFTS